MKSVRLQMDFIDFMNNVNTFYFLVEISILSFLTEIYYYLYAKYSDKLHILKRKSKANKKLLI